MDALESGTSIASSGADLLPLTGKKAQFLDLCGDAHGVRPERLNKQFDPLARDIHPGCLGQFHGQKARLLRGIAREIDLRRNDGIELSHALQLGLVLAFQLVPGGVQHQDQARRRVLQQAGKLRDRASGRGLALVGLGAGSPAGQRGIGVRSPNQPSRREQGHGAGIVHNGAQGCFMEIVLRQSLLPVLMARKDFFSQRTAAHLSPVRLRSEEQVRRGWVLAPQLREELLGCHAVRISPGSNSQRRARRRGSPAPTPDRSPQGRLSDRR